jgi:hypothetical protein
MNIYTGHQEQARYGSHETVCPYNGINVCMASFSSMAIDNQKRDNCCGTDNYDNCPIFLSKVLRKV